MHAYHFWNFCTIKADRLHSVGADQSDWTTGHLVACLSDWSTGCLSVRLEHRLFIWQTGAQAVYLSVRPEQTRCLDAPALVLFICLSDYSTDKVCCCTSISPIYQSVRLEQMRCLDASTSVPFICRTKAQTSWSPNSKHWFTTSFLQPLPYLVTPLVPKNCQLTSSFLLVLKQ